MARADFVPTAIYLERSGAGLRLTFTASNAAGRIPADESRTSGPRAASRLREKGESFARAYGVRFEDRTGGADERR